MTDIFEEYLQPHDMTGRLTARKLEQTDQPVWESYFIDNPNLRFFNLDGDINIPEQSQAWLERQFKRYHENRFGLMALINKQTQEFVGTCGLLLQEVNGNPEVEVGYHILPRFWRQGYATEAALYFKQYAFSHRICDALVSIIHIENIGSQKWYAAWGTNSVSERACLYLYHS